ncbi:MAG: hypothetical protein A2341_09000 [Deltaproteobacteria bacterium RIFOXYB12_FULL_58_9]|nr:MAG: hypothetical protein A2341_09000 [Deltaproteobacteria bacterium RIFOXYB12_FULL_58_9]
MTESNPTDQRRPHALCMPAILLSASLFIFGPLSTFVVNSSELKASLPALAPYFVSAFGFLVVALFAVGYVLPARMVDPYRVALLVAGSLVWIQGSLLVWDYGLLDGQGIDWRVAPWRGWVEFSVWTITIFLSVRLFRKILPVVGFASVTLLVIQSVGTILSVTGLNQSETQQTEVAEQLPPQLSEFSTQSNVIHIVLDGFQTDVFETILNEGQRDLKNALDGFVFFRENMGAFPTTYMSIPAILSGRVYNNTMPMRRFVTEVLDGETIPSVLFNAGYRVELAVEHSMYCQGPRHLCYQIPHPYGTSNESKERFAGSVVADLTLFRIAPHWLKPFIYNDQSWLLQRLMGAQDDTRYPAIAAKAFATDLLSRSKLGSNQPVYKFIHLLTPHPPFVLDEECKSHAPIAGSRDAILRQSRCATSLVIKILNKLRSLELYDSSLIVIQADHGAGYPVNMESDLNASNILQRPESPSIVGSAVALLAIKPPDNRGPLQISHLPTMLTDVPATIADLLGLAQDLPGRSAFAEGEKPTRLRHYFNYTWRNENWQAEYLRNLDTYVVAGSVYDERAWSMQGRRFRPGLRLSTLKVDMGEENSRAFMGEGWSADEQVVIGQPTSVVWALGPTAAIFNGLPAGATEMTARFLTPKYDSPEIITILVDSKEIGSWKIAGDGAQFKSHRINLPADKDRPDTSSIEFQFSQFRKYEMGSPDLRPTAVLFDYVAFAPDTAE